MFAVEFTLYRFVCDLATFTGLFSADAEGRQIPDTAAFTCCWSRVPRATQATMNPAQLKHHGTSSSTFFKSLGPDMALTFANAHTCMQVNGDTTVLTFQIRPTEFDGGDIPVIAKGTLDPVPYFGKPKKNYVIKLRDASGQVIGKLLFALEVSELDEDNDAVERERSAGSASVGRLSGGSGSAEKPKPPVARALDTNHPSRSSSSNRSSRSSSFDDTKGKTLSQERPRRSTSSGRSGSSAPAVAPASQPTVTAITTQPRKASPARESSRPSTERIAPTDKLSRPMAVAAAPTLQPEEGRPPASGGRGHSAEYKQPPQGLVLLMERVSVKPSAIDLAHPAPLLLESEYYLKVRYGPQTYYTAPVICQNPKELPFGAQRVAVTLNSTSVGGAPSSEKLRFSLWENEKQVAGFSLDPDKFRVEPDKVKEYAIPFRYHPTQQSACLDVGVMRTAPPSPPPVGATATSAISQPVRRPSPRARSRSPRDGSEGPQRRRRSPGEGSRHPSSNGSHHAHRRSPRRGSPQEEHSDNQSHPPHHSNHHRHHRHPRTASDGSSLSAESARRKTPPPSSLAPTAFFPIPPPQTQQPSTAPAPQFAPAPTSSPPVQATRRHHADPQPQTTAPSVERPRSTSSPPPRPTNAYSTAASRPALTAPTVPAPVPAAFARATDRRGSEIETPTLWGPSSASGPSGFSVGGGAAGPAVPQLTPKRCDSSPRPLGVPDTPPRDGSRDRGTPLRSCLPRDVDHSGLLTSPHTAKLASPSKDGPPASSAFRAQPQQPILVDSVLSRPDNSSPRRTSPRTDHSVVADYMAKAALAKSQNEIINSARKESVESRRPSPSSQTPRDVPDREHHRHSGSTRRRRTASSRRSDGNASERSGGHHSSGSRRRRHRSRSPGHTTEPAGPTAARPPTDFREHEKYLHQVMARLNQQARAPAQRSSLVEEWLGWRDETSQRNSRCNSVLSDRGRSPSVAGSAISRDDSVASVVSRRASPLPTKSFANFAMQSPYQPEYSRPRRTSSVNSLRERRSLIG